MKPKPKPVLTTFAITLAVIALNLSARAEDSKPTVNPTGTWKVSYPPKSAQATDPTLILKLEEDKLTGTITRATGRTTEQLAIADGKVKGDQITFSVRHYARAYKDGVTQPADKDQVVQRKFQGRMSGEVIKGKVEQSYQGNARTRAWEARRVKK